MSPFRLHLDNVMLQWKNEKIKGNPRHQQPKVKLLSPRFAPLSLE